MNALVSRHPAALALEALARLLATGSRAVRRSAAGLDRRIARRRRAARDLDLLSTMSERELADIGVNRSSIAAIAAGAWQRER